MVNLRSVGWGSMRVSQTVPQAMGWVGFTGAEMLFYLSAPFTFRRILKEKSVAGFDHIPYVMGVATNVCWVSYGAVTPGRFQPLLTNAVGMVAEVTYVCIFLRLAKGRQRIALIRDILWTVVLLGLMEAYAFYPLPFPSVNDENSTSSLLGICAAVVNIIMFAAPLKQVEKVIETQSVEFMPFSLCFGGFICGGAWTCYAILIGDISVFIPNFAGVLTSILQFIVYVIYRGVEQKKKKKSPAVVYDSPRDAVEDDSPKDYYKLPKTHVLLQVNSADDEEKEENPFKQRDRSQDNPFIHNNKDRSNTLNEPLLP